MVARLVVRAFSCAAIFFAAGASAAPASLDGTWSAGPLTAKWVIGDWGPACGPQPAGGGEGAATIIVHETAGELVLTGGGRVYSTTNCWEQNPNFQKASHSASSRSWKTTCKTPATDPRQATVTTTLSATDDRISFYETGQYQFVIKDQNCTASVGRYRTYSLVQRGTAPAGLASTPAAPATPPSASATPPPAKKVEAPPKAPPSDRCKSPGPPARLEVRPARKLVRAGEEFAFRAIVADAAGCVVHAKPTWAIESGQGQGELSQTGVVKVNASATEGEMRLTASVAGRSASVVVEVATTTRYDSLLKSGAFNAAGEVDEAASVTIASQSIGAAPTVAKDLASDRKHIFVALVGAVAAALAIGAFILFRKSRSSALSAGADPRRVTPPPSVPSPSAPSPSGPLSSGPQTPPAMAFGPGSTQVVPPEAMGPTRGAMGGGAAGGGFGGGMTIAVPGPGEGPRFGGMTIEASGPPGAAPVRPQPKTLCPVCGTEYGPESRFCGKDGATLVPMN
jgi:hypothetical protein